MQSQQGVDWKKCNAYRCIRRKNIVTDKICVLSIIFVLPILRLHFWRRRTWRKKVNHVEKLLFVNMLNFKNVLYSVQLCTYIDFEDMLSNQEAWNIRIVWAPAEHQTIISSSANGCQKHNWEWWWAICDIWVESTLYKFVILTYFWNKWRCW